LIGGALGTLIGLRPVLWIASAGGVIGFLLLLPSPLPAFRMPRAAGARKSQELRSRRVALAPHSSFPA
jgi:predicted MFS family arabinose efflux permease